MTHWAKDRFGPKGLKSRLPPADVDGMWSVRRQAPVPVAVLVALALSGCAQSTSPNTPPPSADVVAAASAINLPGTPQPCQNTSSDSTDRCSLAKVTARAAASDVSRQLQSLGLMPSPTKCEKASVTTPESCTVQVVASGPHALTFVASPHLLPSAPARFDGVETVLISQ